MAYKVLQEVGADETLRAELRFQEKAARDRIAELTYAQKEYLEQGARRKALEIARNLLAIEWADAAIVQATGLSEKAVCGLRESCKN